MPKPSKKEAILQEGLRLCLTNGFSAASVRDITRAAGAPLGTFNNHFASKEEFGLEILDLYREIWRKRFATTILDETIPPLEAFGRFFDGLRDDMERYEWKTGCLLSHYSLEVGSQSDLFRERLIAAHDERSGGFAAGLSRAVQAGEINPAIDCSELGEVLDEGLQGATMKLRVKQSPEPYDRFRRYVFKSILRR